MKLPPSEEIKDLKRGDNLLESGVFPVVWTLQ